MSNRIVEQGNDAALDARCWDLRENLTVVVMVVLCVLIELNPHAALVAQHPHRRHGLLDKGHHIDDRHRTRGCLAGRGQKQVVHHIDQRESVATDVRHRRRDRVAGGEPALHYLNPRVEHRQGGAEFVTGIRDETALHPKRLTERTHRAPRDHPAEHPGDRNGDDSDDHQRHEYRRRIDVDAAFAGLRFFKQLGRLRLIDDEEDGGHHQKQHNRARPDGDLPADDSRRAPDRRGIAVGSGTLGTPRPAHS